MVRFHWTLITGSSLAATGALLGCGSDGYGTGGNHEEAEAEPRVGQEQLRAAGSARLRSARKSVLNSTVHPKDQGQGVFQPLEDPVAGVMMSQVEDTNDDGTVVVGYATGDPEDMALRWTSSGGLRPLQGEDGQAHAVSPNGQLIVGSVADPAWNGRAAVIWREGEDPTPLYVDPRPEAMVRFWFNEPYAVTDAGVAYGMGVQEGALGEALALAGTETTVTLLYGMSVAYGVTRDGAVPVGVVFPSRHGGFMEAVRGSTGLGFPTADAVCTPSTCESTAVDTTSDGSVVVGTATIPSDASSGPHRTAFTWTEEEGVSGLPGPDGGESGAHSVSDFGHIVGYAGAEARHAVVWVDGVARRLDQGLADSGVEVPAGWILEEAVGISADGGIVVGNGLNPEGERQGWRVVLPAELRE